MVRRPAANKIKDRKILATVSAICKYSKIFHKSGKNWQLEFAFTIYEQLVHFVSCYRPHKSC